jgi:DNA-binding response OmpR family regulator
MQLLIVHDDVEVGEQLAAMVKEYTDHHCGYAKSDAAALDWARGVSRCSLLITQLRGEGVDGLSLGGSLSEMFAGLQTMFLPAYSADEQRLDLSDTKVFPEPIDGEQLLNAIARAEAQRQTGMDLFHALDVLQMCCLSQRDGALQLVQGSKTALVFLKQGNIIHAERGASRDAAAIYEISGWEAVEFAYDQYVRAPAETLKTRWDETIIAAIEQRKTQIVGAGAASVQATEAQPAKADAKTGKRGLFRGLRS